MPYLWKHSVSCHSSFVWDGDEIVMELSDSGKVQKRYIRGNDLVYADQGEGTEKQYYVKNPHGDVVQLTDESGKVIKTYEYDSFGNEVKPNGKDENPFRYCGEYYDKETEEVYLRARYYQPGVGRFLTRDTYTGEEDEQLSLHLYTYCKNDSINNNDPTGHWDQKIHKGLTKAIARAYGFEKKDALLLAMGDRGADHITKSKKWFINIKVPDSDESIKITLADVGTKIFTHNKKNKPDLHKIYKKQYDKAAGKAKKIGKSKRKFEEKLILMGMWLHARQDRWAHGLKEQHIKHKGKTDNYLYDFDWGKKNIAKSLIKSKLPNWSKKI